MSRTHSDEPLMPVLAAFTTAWPTQDTSAIRAAYRVASHYHHGQRRHSGDPFISHPLEVALIVARTRAPRDLICAALLHDVADPHQRLGDQFGPRVAALVDGLSRLHSTDNPTSADPDVVLLKLADRLHNLRTVKYLAPDKRRRKSEETLTVLVPMATRLGMDNLGRELSDLAAYTLRQTSPATPSSPATRTLNVAAILLPPTARARFVAEWAGELAVLPTRSARARFAGHLILGMPRLAKALRTPADTKDTAKRSPAPAIAAGATTAIALNATMTWPGATVALAALTLTAAILFIPTDRPLHRLRELLDHWRNR